MIPFEIISHTVNSKPRSIRFRAKKLPYIQQKKGRKKYLRDQSPNAKGWFYAGDISVDYSVTMSNIFGTDVENLAAEQLCRQIRQEEDRKIMSQFFEGDVELWLERTLQEEIERERSNHV